MPKFLLLFIRILAVIVLVPLVIVLILNIAAPSVLMAAVTFITQLRVLPIWGCWVVLVASVVLLGVAFIPMLPIFKGKSNAQEESSDDTSLGL